jgi:lipoprotein-anchoring transpeptidase ErfK/SrfK
MKAKNLITTRILRLRGLEDGVNRGNGIDSYDRYIYIHGTNHEDRIGSPSSSGCLQLANQDVLQLHDLAEEGMHLWIENVNCD